MNTRVFIAPPTFCRKKGRKQRELTAGKENLSSRHSRETFSQEKALLLCKTEETCSEIYPSCGGVNVWANFANKILRQTKFLEWKIKQWLFPPKKDELLPTFFGATFFIRKTFYFECLSFEKFLTNSIKDIKQSSQRFCKGGEKKKTLKSLTKFFN